jgi:RND family efflux transporter MFP subunit
MTDFRTLSAALGILLLPLLGGCREAASSDGTRNTPVAAAGAAVRVEVVRPQRKMIRQTVEEPAQIRPYEETPIYAKVTGYIRKIPVDIGDRVRGPRWDSSGKEISPGQVLAELSIPELEEEMRQKEALVAQARANIQQARATIRLSQAGLVTAQAAVTQADAAVKRNRSQYEKVLSEHQRYAVLAAKGAVTEKLVDESRDQVDSSAANCEEAAAKVESARAAVLESKASLEKADADLVTAQARLRVAEADYARLVAMVGYGTLRAPYDGVVTRRNLHTGHLVQPGTQSEPMLILMRTDILRVQIDVPEADAIATRPGERVSIRLPAFPGIPIAATVSRTASSLDTRARTLRIEADVVNADGRLYPGMYAYATIVIAEHPDALIVPASAVFSAPTGTGSFCACVESGKVVAKRVTLGLRKTDEVEITSGLTGAESVIRANSATLSEGQNVEPIPYVPPKA